MTDSLGHNDERQVSDKARRDAHSTGPLDDPSETPSCRPLHQRQLEHTSVASVGSWVSWASPSSGLGITGLTQSGAVGGQGEGQGEDKAGFERSKS